MSINSLKTTTYPIVLILSLLTCCCSYSSRSSAEKNTEYAPELKTQISQFDSLQIGMSINDVDELIGKPLRILSETGSPDVSVHEFFDGSFSRKGNYYLHYSQQINPALDYIRKYVYFRNGKIERIEDIWYNE